MLFWLRRWMWQQNVRIDPLGSKMLKIRSSLEKKYKDLLKRKGFSSSNTSMILVSKNVPDYYQMGKSLSLRSFFLCMFLISGIRNEDFLLITNLNIAGSIRAMILMMTVWFLITIRQRHLVLVESLSLHTLTRRNLGYNTRIVNS